MKLFKNCSIFDPYTNQILENSCFSVENDKIRGIFLKDETPDEKYDEEIDLGGKIVIPGLIDAHMHCESTLLTPSHTSFIAQRGTVVCVADPHEITNVLGENGFNFFLQDSLSAIVDFRFAIPSCVPATPFETNGATITAESVHHILESNPAEGDYRHVIGLAEVMNVPGVLSGDLDPMLNATKKFHGHIDGHAPMASPQVLNKLIFAGIQTDHECTTTKELFDRLHRGMAVLFREGTSEHNVQTLSTGLLSITDPVSRSLATRNCAFCTDDRRIDDILKDGHIDNAIRVAIKTGIDPRDAVRMATLNAAQMFSLPEYGAIAPGKNASFCVLQSSLADFHISEVYIKGKKFSEVDQELSVKAQLSNEEVKRWNIMKVDMNTVKEQLEKAVFEGPAIGVIPNQIVTTAEMKNDKSLMLVVVERYTGKSEMGHCPINNVSLGKDAAVASTVAHDSHNIVCIGSSKKSMLKAIELLVEAGGGYSVVNGENVQVLPLPIAGLVTNQDKETLVNGLEKFSKGLEEAGVSKEFDLMMTLSFMCLPVIPKYKLTNKGLFDAQIFQFVEQK